MLIRQQQVMTGGRRADLEPARPTLNRKMLFRVLENRCSHVRVGVEVWVFHHSIWIWLLGSTNEFGFIRVAST